MTSPTATLTSYRKILNVVWRGAIGKFHLRDVRYSMLIPVIDGKTWHKKTYNNVISALRQAFAFGFQDYPECHNPAVHLKCLRLRRRDRPKIDPFAIHDAERLIAAIHKDWGEAAGNYDEFRFFTGLRCSEQIALTVTDYKASMKVLSVSKARVHGLLKDRTKTDEDRLVELCPRAIEVVERQLRLREKLVAQGLINHDLLFFEPSGAPIMSLAACYQRWRLTLARLSQIRYRRPYYARHCSVSWNLMIGKHPLWVSKQHGHSLETMLRTYAAWVEGAMECDIEAVRLAMQASPIIRIPDEAVGFSQLRLSAADATVSPACSGQPFLETQM